MARKKSSDGWTSGWTIPNEVGATTKLVAFIMAAFGLLIIWQPGLLFYLLGIMLLVIGIVGAFDDKKPALIELLFGVLILASIFYLPEYTIWLVIFYFIILGLEFLATSKSGVGKLAGILMLLAAAFFYFMPIYLTFAIGAALIVGAVYLFVEGVKGI